MANVKKPAPAAKPAKAEEKTYTRSELDALVKAAVAEALKGAQSGGDKERIVLVNNEERVTVYFFGVVSPETSVKLGDLGVIPRAGIPLEISKKDFTSAIIGLCL